jgi:hypothetical protein
LIRKDGFSSPIVADKTAKHNEGIESSEMISIIFKPEIKTSGPGLFWACLNNLGFDILDQMNNQICCLVTDC